MTTLGNQLHPSWARELQDLLPSLDKIEEKLSGDQFLPALDNVMRALSSDLATARVLIVGQDPYPNIDHAMGLAFSVPPVVTNLPPTLRNIFRELESDLDITWGSGGDLTPWHEQGVVLLNRTLTCREGESNSHLELGWREITDRCAQVLGEKGAVAILWGKNAAELSRFFSSEKVISSAHPSPLSSYRGFFGSKPFSRANQILSSEGKAEINWGKKNSVLQR